MTGARRPCKVCRRAGVPPPRSSPARPPAGAPRPPGPAPAIRRRDRLARDAPTSRLRPRPACAPPHAGRIVVGSCVRRPPSPFDPCPCAPRLASSPRWGAHHPATERRGGGRGGGGPAPPRGASPPGPRPDQALPKLDESGPNPGRFRATASRPQGCCSPSHSDWGRRVEGRAGAGMPLPFVL